MGSVVDPPILRTISTNLPPRRSVRLARSSSGTALAVRTARQAKRWRHPGMSGRCWA